MPKKRIAVIVPGGIGVGHYNEGVPALEALLAKLGKHHDVCVFPLGKVNNDYQPVNFRLFPLQEAYTRPLALRMFKTSQRLMRQHRQRSFDLLHAFWGYPAGLLAAWWSRRWQIPSLVSLMGGELVHLPDIGYGSPPCYPKRQLTEWTLRRADATTTLTTYQQGLLPGDKFRNRNRVVPLGVDTSLFAYQPARPKGPWQFIHIANLNMVKDQLMLLRAFARIREAVDARLTIVGPDYLHGKLQAWVGQQGLGCDVIFTGYVRHKELTCYLHRAHIMLHTSRYEAMGVVLAEAMATGVMVAGTRVGLLADLTPEYGVGVEVGDEVTLAQQVLELLDDQERQLRLRTWGRRWAEQYDLNWTTQQFGNLYEELAPLRKKGVKSEFYA